MTRRAAALAVLISGPLLTAGSTARTAPAGRSVSPRNDYVLACGGCHGLGGVSNPSLVPRLNGLVGYYLNLPEGRAYLARVPNVAFSSMNDDRLAAVLNYLVFEIGGRSAPAGSKPYSAAEVGKLRKRPLTEVPLLDYRQRLVETLIREYRAPAALRTYGEEFYGADQ
jgi:cytochrome c553